MAAITRRTYSAWIGTRKKTFCKLFCVSVVISFFIQSSIENEPYNVNWLNKVKMLTFQSLMILLRSVLKLRAAVMTSSMRSQFSLPSALSPKERLIWVDCEMTGLDIKTDKLLEIAVIVTEGDTLATVGSSNKHEISPKIFCIV